jgi:DNA-binding Xre family transcriptional regulator
VRVQSAPVVSQGTVVSRLAALQTRAGETWGVRVTQQMLVEATGISHKMIQPLCIPSRRQTIKRFDLRALGKLCWFFDCDIDQLLTYLPPGAPFSSLPPVQVKRAHPPKPGEVPRLDQLVHTRLPDILKKEKVVSIMGATGKKRDSISTFRNGTPRSIRYTTLLAVCDAAYQMDHDPAQIQKALAYTPEAWAGEQAQ